MGIYKQGGHTYGRFMYRGKRHDGYALNEFTDSRGEPKDRQEEEQAFERFKESVRTGKLYQPRDVDSSMSVAQFSDHYIAVYWKKKNRAEDTSIIKVIGRYFGTKPISTWSNPNVFVAFKNHLLDTPIEITRRYKDGSRVRTKTKKFRKPSTWNRYYARCRHMAKLAAALKLIDSSPFEGDALTELIGKEEEAEGRARGVTDAEQQALYKACDLLRDENEAMRERLEFAFAIGCRRKEMQRLQLEDIDFDDWTVTFHGHKEVDGKRVRNTKSGKTRIVPIPLTLRDLMKGKRKLFKPTAFLFGNGGVYVASFRGAWEHLKTLAKLDNKTLAKKGQMGLHWHDLRGESGTRMIRKGHSFEIVAEVLGNTPAVLRKHYKGDLLDVMRKAVDA